MMPLTSQPSSQALRQQVKSADGFSMTSCTAIRSPTASWVLTTPTGQKRRWFLYDSGERHAEETRSPDRGGVPLMTLPGDREMLYAACRGFLDKNLKKARRPREESGDAIFAEELHPLCFPRGRPGTIEMIRAQGCKVGHLGGSRPGIRSGVESRATRVSPRRGTRDRRSITQRAFTEAARRVSAGESFTEFDLQEWIVAQFLANGVVSDSPPIVAVGPHSGDPHYEPRERGSSPIRRGDLLLLDIWAKTIAPNSVYYDITWVRIPR